MILFKVVLMVWELKIYGYSISRKVVTTIFMWIKQKKMVFIGCLVDYWVL